MTSVLIVEDEQHIADGLRFNLEAEGYTAEVAPDGETALRLLLEDRRPFHAIVLDVMLPGKDGFTVAAELRRAKSHVPILILTARGRSDEVLKGFEAGADDYLAKPFELGILIARLRGLLRRSQWNAVANEGTEPPESFEFAGRTIDFRNLELRYKDSTYELTAMEGDLLQFLVRNAGKTVSRKDLLENVWGLHEDTDTRAIDNFVVRLRRYIEDQPAKPKILVTVRGVGYRFTPVPQS